MGKTASRFPKQSLCDTVIAYLRFNYRRLRKKASLRRTPDQSLSRTPVIDPVFIGAAVYSAVDAEPE
jgi:hypothetical protein